MMCNLAAGLNSIWHTIGTQARKTNGRSRNDRLVTACRIFGCLNRDGRIRTGDPLNPIQVRYRAALRPGDDRGIIADGSGPGKRCSDFSEVSQDAGRVANTALEMFDHQVLVGGMCP